MKGGGRRLRGKHCVAVPWSVTDSLLAQRSLVRIPVPGDGNCQFHALSIHTDFDHVGLRASVIEFLSLHIHLFSEFLSYETAAGYLRRMSLPSAWGDHITLMAAARILNRTIHVVSDAGVRVIECPTADNSPIWLAYNGVHYDAVVSAPSVPCLGAPALCAQQSVDMAPSSVPLDSHPVQPVSTSLLSCPLDSPAGVPDFPSQPACSAVNLSISSCDITSLRKKIAMLDFADVIGIQESRHTALEIPSLAVKLRSIGYNILLGYHVIQRLGSKKKARTFFNGVPGGVALAFRPHVAAQLAP